ncbi:efflux RND transporter periplasmic adaptor subunit [Pseudoduganella buxea]|uniref:Efflux RND transporter periplasmic adaptor subunit n=1 Tax=Pseudoduganella buxea TaxID=1949069 RepID=A0A6I3T1B2_9BURK|nr:efflux RND transporter periplasmic adaptor subunit [Pseudoduganella buxea]MTV55263.1 efflux RND transporter periplasmic adaptor subunit [Pseudoduganella buxea]GGC24524.1 multidrug transporter [Pseudoduganella buxea]
MHVPKFLPALTLVAAAAIAAATLTACSKPAEKTEDIRPVRAIVLAGSDIDVNAEFSGEVRPRYESRLGFRVPGKITARRIEVGSTVRKGQVLMQLDPQDLQLAQAQAMASLRAAETSRDLADAELKRYRELRRQNFVSQAVLDQRESAYKSAQANVEAARASYRSQSNQAGYASLVSDIDGVVTAIDAEAGQVVAAGTPVVRVARTDEKEVVFGVPEDQVEQLRKLPSVTVRLWADPQNPFKGTIREVSPVADPATRTYAFKVALPPGLNQAKLGMTAVVQFESRAKEPRIKVPLTSLYHEKNATSVWVVEGGVAKLVPVTVAGADGNELILASGVKAGQTVVTAGVHLLKPGQRVRILGNDLPQDKQDKAVPAGAAR